MRIAATFALGLIILLIWMFNHQHKSSKIQEIQLNELNSDIKFSPQKMNSKQMSTLKALKIPPKPRLLLLSHWQTWCKPCVLELPALKKLQNQFDKSQLTVVLVNSDPLENQQNAKKLLENLGIFALTKVFISGEQNFIGFESSVLPSTWLISNKGYVLKHWEGAFNWSSRQAQYVFAKALEFDENTHR